MGRVAFLFAGQGAQYPGMGASLYQTSPAAQAVFDKADRLRPGTSEQCFKGTAEELAETINTQPCLFTVDYACAAALQEAGVNPDLLAGFSLGELAAVTFANMLSFEEAFTLVTKRAELMQASAKKHPGAMTAVLRLEAKRVEELAASVAGVYPVNYNAPGQTVVSGNEEALTEFEAAVKEAGGRAMRLAVSGSFHSPFMAEASKALREYLGTLDLAAPTLSLYANVTAEPYGASKENSSAELLAQQVQSPVLFQQSIEHMIRDGATAFIEVGAGKTLRGLVKKIDPSVFVSNVQDTESLQGTLELLKEADLC